MERVKIVRRKADETMNTFIATQVGEAFVSVIPLPTDTDDFLSKIVFPPARNASDNKDSGKN